MKRPSLILLAGAAAIALAQPAAAQHQGHNMPGMQMPAPKKAAPKKKAAPTKKAAPKKGAAKKPAAKNVPAKKAAAKPAADPHTGHDMATMPEQQAPAGEAPAMQQMPGHDMSTMQTPAPAATTPPDPHAGHTMPAQPQPQPQMPSMPSHDMGAMPGMEMPAVSATGAEGTNLPAGNAPPPPVPVANAADAFYDRMAMEHARQHLQQFHGGQKLYQVMANIAEAQFGKGPTGFEWDAEGWYGGDINRMWVKSEGEGAFGRSIDKAELQALYSRAIGPYFNLQGGLRYDFKPDPSRIYATLGLEGLAPSFFELEAFGFLSNKGELMGRVSGYYDQRITQRLILQPRAEINFAAQNSRELGIGAGIHDAEIGVRLRYDIRREFAPYVGIQYRTAIGRTRRFLREEGEDPEGWSLLTGVRLWF